MKVKTFYFKAKKTAVFFFVSAFAITLYAQEAVDLAGNSAPETYIGLKGGLNMPSLSYGNPDINSYKSEFYTKSFWGIFAEIPLNPQNTFSIRPEVNFITRGQHIDDQGVNYKMDAEYTHLYLPFIYTFRSKNKAAVSPYVLLAPGIGFATGGEIRLDDWKTDISDANLNAFDIGLYGGIGVKFPVYGGGREIFSIGLELGYYLGITDTYSQKEKDNEAEALNIGSYDIQGTRRHTGIQAQVSAAVPLSLFKAKKKPAPAVVPEPEPVVVPVEVFAPQIVEKECYTLEEMKALIREKKEIVGKKICAIRQITFEFGKANLNKASQDYLNEIVSLMKENGIMKITVNGHTDNVGAPEYNLNLSKTRAKAVYDYLVKSGIASSRLDYRYYGMTKPIAENDTEDGRAINRRVEFEIINQ